MWPMGHVAIAYLLLVAIGRFRDISRPDETSVLIVVVAAILPDLIDKPLAWYLAVLPTGRSLAHSFVFLVPLCVVVGALAWRNGRPQWAAAFAIGTISHVLVDALPVLWREDASASFLLYPITEVDPYGETGPPGVAALLLDSATDPYFLIEFPLLAIAAVVWYRQGMPGWSVLRSVSWRGSEEEAR